MSVNEESKEKRQRGREKERKEGERSTASISRVKDRKGEIGAIYLRIKCGTSKRPGTSTNAGKVIRLKIPNTLKAPMRPAVKREERFCVLKLTHLSDPGRHSPRPSTSWKNSKIPPTLSTSNILCINTNTHRTTTVSTLFEKVFV